MFSPEVVEKLLDKLSTLDEQPEIEQFVIGGRRVDTIMGAFSYAEHHHASDILRLNPRIRSDIWGVPPCLWAKWVARWSPWLADHPWSSGRPWAWPPGIPLPCALDSLDISVRGAWTTALEYSSTTRTEKLHPSMLPFLRNRLRFLRATLRLPPYLRYGSSIPETIAAIYLIWKGKRLGWFDNL